MSLYSTGIQPFEVPGNGISNIVDVFHKTCVRFEKYIIDTIIRNYSDILFNFGRSLCKVVKVGVDQFNPTEDDDVTQTMEWTETHLLFHIYKGKFTLKDLDEETADVTKALVYNMTRSYSDRGVPQFPDVVKVVVNTWSVANGNDEEKYTRSLVTNVEVRGTPCL